MWRAALKKCKWMHAQVIKSMTSLELSGASNLQQSVHVRRCDPGHWQNIPRLAMQCLKSIFIVPNRPQIHAATVALLHFISDKVSAGESVVQLSEKGKHDSGWAVSIYKLICRWAPVQDRYVILVVAMDTLVNNPVKEDKMDQQVALISIIGSILRSDVNLIGLSVMDVLLGLVNQIRKLFGPTSGVSRSGSTVEDDRAVALAGAAALAQH